MLIVSSTVGSPTMHRLEAPLERGVLLDVLPVLVERRRADRVQLAARQHRLQHVRRVHRAFGRAGADDGVQLVDEEDDLALGVGDLLEHGLQPLLELAAVLRAGDERAHVERDDALVLEAFGHVAADDAAGEAFDDGRLADAGLADEHRVVLRAARQHLDDAADFLVAADHRIELALARQLGEVAAVALERLVGAFGVLARHALRAAHARQRLRRSCRCVMPRCCQQLRGGGAARSRDAMREEQVLGADELVLQPLGFGLRRVGDQLQPRRQAAAASRRTPAASCRAARAPPRRSRPGRRSSSAAAPGRCRRAARRARRAGARARSARGSSARRAAARRATASWAFSVYLLMFIVVLMRPHRVVLRRLQLLQRFEVRRAAPASARAAAATSTVA